VADKFKQKNKKLLHKNLLIKIKNQKILLNQKEETPPKQDTDHQRRKAYHSFLII